MDPNSIDPNPIKNQLDPHSRHFPRGYLVATCTACGVKSSMDFTEKFFLNMEIDWLKLKDQHYKKVVDHLPGLINESDEFYITPLNPSTHPTAPFAQLIPSARCKNQLPPLSKHALT